MRWMINPSLNVVLHGLFFIFVVAPLFGMPVFLWKVACIMVMFEIFDWCAVSPIRRLIERRHCDKR